MREAWSESWIIMLEVRAGDSLADREMSSAPHLKSWHFVNLCKHVQRIFFSHLISNR